MATIRLAGMRSRRSDSENTRMGPVALFTLMAVLCLAVLAVLAVATANAALSLSERRALATEELYLDETAAQTFVAALDEALATGSDADAALQSATDAARDTASTTGDRALEVSSAHSADGSYTASFDCGNGRQLQIALVWEPDEGPLITQWRMTTVVNDEPTFGNLLGGS